MKKGWQRFYEEKPDGKEETTWRYLAYMEKEYRRMLGETSRDDVHWIQILHSRIQWTSVTTPINLRISQNHINYTFFNKAPTSWTSSCSPWRLRWQQRNRKAESVKGCYMMSTGKQLNRRILETPGIRLFGKWVKVYHSSQRNIRLTLHSSATPLWEHQNLARFWVKRHPHRDILTQGSSEMRVADRVTFVT